MLSFQSYRVMRDASPLPQVTRAEPLRFPAGLSATAASRCLLALPPQSADADDVTGADRDVILMRQWRRELRERLAPENVVPLR